MLFLVSLNCVVQSEIRNHPSLLLRSVFPHRFYFDRASNFVWVSVCVWKCFECICSYIVYGRTNGRANKRTNWRTNVDYNGACTEAIKLHEKKVVYFYVLLWCWARIATAVCIRASVCSMLRHRTNIGGFECTLMPWCIYTYSYTQTPTSHVSKHMNENIFSNVNRLWVEIFQAECMCTFVCLVWHTFQVYLWAMAHQHTTNLFTLSESTSPFQRRNKTRTHTNTHQQLPRPNTMPMHCLFRIAVNEWNYIAASWLHNLIHSSRCSSIHTRLKIIASQMINYNVIQRTPSTRYMHREELHGRRKKNANPLQFLCSSQNNTKKKYHFVSFTCLWFSSHNNNWINSVSLCDFHQLLFHHPMLWLRSLYYYINEQTTEEASKRTSECAWPLMSSYALRLLHFIYRKPVFTVGWHEIHTWACHLAAMN